MRAAPGRISCTGPAHTGPPGSETSLPFLNAFGRAWPPKGTRSRPLGVEDGGPLLESHDTIALPALECAARKELPAGLLPALKPPGRSCVLPAGVTRLVIAPPHDPADLAAG